MTTLPIYTPCPSLSFRVPNPALGRSPTQHFLRVLDRSLGDGLAAQHARDLIDAFFFIEQPNLGVRPVFPDGFDHAIVTVSHARDLRQMGDAEHLAFQCNMLEPFPDL